MVNPIEILSYFYPEDTQLRRLLIQHSTQVRMKALEILDAPGNNDLPIDRALVETGALLHDIGIIACNAPSIYCEGKEPYIAHGLIGGRMLREYGTKFGCDMECYARICERHTGAGLTAADVMAQKLPLPVADYLPETLEEKVVCLADKFFSKSKPQRELPFDAVRRSMLKHGQATLDRFDALCALFHL